jgi:hypothetical protein
MDSAALIQLRRLIRTSAGLSPSDDFFTDDVLNDVINMAIDEVEDEARWPWQQATEVVTVAAGTAVIPVPEMWRATKALFDDIRELREVSITDALAWSTLNLGAPQVWAQDTEQVLVRPAPGSEMVLTMVFYMVPIPLVLDTDMPMMPASFARGAVVAKAAELVYTREGERSQAADKLAAYEKWITRMRRDGRRSTGPPRVRIRPGGWL